MPSFDLTNYIPVAERLNQAQPDILSIMADPPLLLSDTHGYIRVTVLLRDNRSATGTASFRLDLAGKSAQATNPIEDSETSAVGRALAMLGYESSRGIASREEVAEAQRRAEQRSAAGGNPPSQLGQDGQRPAPGTCRDCGQAQDAWSMKSERWYCRGCWEKKKKEQGL